MGNYAVNGEWSVYIIRSNDDSLYTGISKDPQKRFEAHKQKKTQAKFFRGKVPKNIVFVESGHTHSSALKREASIKKSSKEKTHRFNPYSFFKIIFKIPVIVLFPAP